MVLTNNQNNSIGQIFTPNYLAEFMVKNCLKFLGKPEALKVLEPSAGKGVFLKNLKDSNFKNITAYEIDDNLKEHLLTAYPSMKFKFENVLGSDLGEKFDLIIGNPPYLGQNYNAELFQDYVKKYPLCENYFVGNMDLFYYFIHLGIEKLNPGGILSYITTHYWITKSKKTGIKFLKPHVLDECFILQYIDLSSLTLFKGAEGQHNCIFVLQKKTEKEKQQHLDKPIEVIQLKAAKNLNPSDEVGNETIFIELNNNSDSEHIKKYISALSNNDLGMDQSWNLLYPEEVKKYMDIIETYCIKDGKILTLQDIFAIRNGIIFIKDEIFILKENKTIRFNINDAFIKINNEFHKLNESEKKILKKVYKSKSIIPYGYFKDDYIGYGIYFNKNEFEYSDLKKRNRAYEEKYPILIKYLKQFESELRDILINAKENPEDILFPRRGSFIRGLKSVNNGKLFDLEPLYDNSNKIFIRYISDLNTFGYANGPYYATSDTYFLWPKVSDKKIDYLFVISYLNSKIMYFLFKAKNISLKRSKTKLEYSVPIPILKNFNKQQLGLLQSIRSLSQELMNNPRQDGQEIKRKIDKLYFQLFDIKEKIIDQLLDNYYN